MKSSHRSPRQILDPELDHMETRLDEVLHRVAPRPTFVTTLRDRLEHESPRPEEPRVFQAFLMSLVSVLGVLVLIAALVRALQALLGMLGFLHQTGRRPAETG